MYYVIASSHLSELAGLAVITLAPCLCCFYMGEEKELGISFV